MSVNEFLKPAFSATIKVGAIQEVGETVKGKRRMIPILGGEFSGEDMEGIILPGGADWQLIRPDGVAEIEALYTMQTSDGIMIYIANKGFRHGPKEVMDRLAKGEQVPPEHYYFRTTPTFEVEQGKYDWLSKTILVGKGQREVDCVRFDFYSLL